MMFGTPCEEYKPNDVMVRALDRIFILHADHEQNASTSTVRLCGSSGTNPFAAIAAGVACLWGPAHGGANEACLNMLQQIQAQGGVAKLGEFVAKVKDPNSGARLMGFGHRVYKNYDPRAKLMRETCYEVLGELGLENDPLFKLAMALEKVALEDDYFVNRKLYPNVDYYSGIVQKALGIPVAMFTGIFSLGAHRRLDRPVAGNDHRSGIQDRPAAPAVQRPRPPRRAGNEAQGLAGRQGSAGDRGMSHAGARRATPAGAAGGTRRAQAVGRRMYCSRGFQIIPLLA